MVWSDDVHSHRAAVASAEARRIARMRQQGSELSVDCGNAGLMSLLGVAGAVGSAIWWQRDGRKLAGHSRTVEKVSSRLQSWQHGIGHQLQHVPLIGHWLAPRGRSQPARQSWQMQEPTNLAGQAAARRMKKSSAPENPGSSAPPAKVSKRASTKTSSKTLTEAAVPERRPSFGLPPISPTIASLPHNGNGVVTTAPSAETTDGGAVGKARQKIPETGKAGKVGSAVANIEERNGNPMPSPGQNGSQPHAMTPRSGNTTPRRVGPSGDALRVPKLNMADSSRDSVPATGESLRRRFSQPGVEASSGDTTPRQSMGLGTGLTPRGYSTTPHAGSLTPRRTGLTGGPQRTATAELEEPVGTAVGKAASAEIPERSTGSGSSISSKPRGIPTLNILRAQVISAEDTDAPEEEKRLQADGPIASKQGTPARQSSWNATNTVSVLTPRRLGLSGAALRVPIASPTQPKAISENPVHTPLSLGLDRETSSSNDTSEAEDAARLAEATPLPVDAGADSSQGRDVRLVQQDLGSGEAVPANAVPSEEAKHTATRGASPELSSAEAVAEPQAEPPSEGEVAAAQSTTKPSTPQSTEAGVSLPAAESAQSDGEEGGLDSVAQLPSEEEHSTESLADSPAAPELPSAAGGVAVSSLTDGAADDSPDGDTHPDVYMSTATAPYPSSDEVDEDDEGQAQSPISNSQRMMRQSILFDDPTKRSVFMDGDATPKERRQLGLDGKAKLSGGLSGGSAARGPTVNMEDWLPSAPQGGGKKTANKKKKKKGKGKH